jgi:uncharacterized membrane protein YcaP (DUF421 family)
MDLSLWSSPAQVGSTVVRTVILYLLAVVASRVAGRRTLSQMSAFDVIVTVALGTLLASAALPSSPAVSDAAAALVTLLVLQVTVAATRQRFPGTQRWIDFRPEIIVREDETTMPRKPWTAQLTVSDLEARLRQQGFQDVTDAKVVVLESNGKISATASDEPGSLFLRPGP